MTNASKRHGARFRARRRAVDVLYEAETRDIDPVAIVEERIELARDPQTGVAPVADYTRTIIEGVAVELDRVDEVVGGHLAEDWALDRLVPVDRAILRVAVWEMLFNEEVPLKTAVAEAVEIAAQLSTDPAPAYVNSVLDAILHKIDELRVESQEQPEDATEDLALPGQDLSFDEAMAHAEQAFDEGHYAAAEHPREQPADESSDAASEESAVEGLVQSVAETDEQVEPVVDSTSEELKEAEESASSQGDGQALESSDSGPVDQAVPATEMQSFLESEVAETSSSEFADPHPEESSTGK